MTYYNTTTENGSTLKTFEAKAERQDVAILNYWRQHPKETFHPEQIQRRIASLGKAPLTSVRRAFSTLAAGGYIRKTEHKVKASYGRRAHLWEYIRG